MILFARHIWLQGTQFFRRQLLYYPLSISDHLGISDLVKVQKAVWEARADWYDIGLGLTISADDLDAIQNDHHGISKTCFREMLKVWLRRSEPSPTWTELAKVLRSPMVDRGHLAEQLPPHST